MIMKFGVLLGCQTGKLPLCLFEGLFASSALFSHQGLRIGYILLQSLLRTSKFRLHDFGSTIIFICAG